MKTNEDIVSLKPDESLLLGDSDGLTLSGVINISGRTAPLISVVGDGVKLVFRDLTVVGSMGEKEWLVKVDKSVNVVDNVVWTDCNFVNIGSAFYWGNDGPDGILSNLYLDNVHVMDTDDI